MKTIKIIASFALFALCLSSCTTTSNSGLTKAKAYPGIYSEKPLAIAVMPPINKTNNVEAKEFLFMTISPVLCERGYYVVPPFLCMEMYKSESAYDAEHYKDGSMKKFGEILGADAVLFTTINKWEKAALANNIYVEIEYVLKSTKTDEIIFQRKGDLTYDTSTNSSGGGLLGALVDMAVSSISAAATPHVKVARICNAYTLSDMPAGIYSPNYDKDAETPAGLKEFRQTVKGN